MFSPEVRCEGEGEGEVNRFIRQAAVALELEAKNKDILFGLGTGGEVGLGVETRCAAGALPFYKYTRRCVF